MAQDDFAWIYLVFFLIIPLSRILPRMIRKWRGKEPIQNDSFLKKPFEQHAEPISQQNSKTFSEDVPRKMKPQSLEMLVLGELNRGIKNFNKIQKNLEIDTEKLDKTLQSLENQGLMKVEHKQGWFGSKIELIPTEKGFKKFYS